MADHARDRRRLAELRALCRLGLATSNAAFEQACADELMAGVFRLLREDETEDPEGRSGTARPKGHGAPSTGMRDGVPSEGAVGVQPAAPHSRPALPAAAPATAETPVAEGGGDLGLPDQDWREARRRLRDAGFEVKQFDGIVLVDGRASRDARLYPPGSAVPVPVPA